LVPHSGLATIHSIEVSPSQFGAHCHRGAVLSKANRRLII
jgi:hypothetical protein